MITFALQLDMDLSTFSLSQSSFGLYLQPFKWLKTWIVHNKNGSFGSFREWQNSGKLTFMNRLNLTNHMKLGIDIYHGDEIEYLLGIESKPTEKCRLKAKIGSNSDFELALRYNPINELNVVFGLLGEFNEDIEKQKCSFGFGLEAAFK